MRVIPKTPAKKIYFFQALLTPWAEHADAIGLSAEEVAEVEAKLDAAKAAFAAQQMARDAARSATLTFHLAAEALAKSGSNAILKIRATAAAADDVSIYPLASLPMPKKGSPVDAPGKPENFTAALGGLGELMLAWKCKNPSNAEGTVYEVSRSVDGGAFEFLGVAGKKKFTDYKLPPGAQTATYRVTAVRSTKRGPVAGYNVNFGVGRENAAIVRAAMAREAA